MKKEIQNKCNYRNMSQREWERSCFSCTHSTGMYEHQVEHNYLYCNKYKDRVGAEKICDDFKFE
jgi:hypothetical protein